MNSTKDVNKKVVFAMLAIVIVAGVELVAATVIGYQDVSLISTPSAPASGFLRTYADTGTNTVKCLLPGSGSCFFAAASSAATLQTNGSNNTSQSVLNFTNASGCTWSNPSGGVVEVSCSGGGGGGGGVNVQSSSYTALSGDDGKLVTFGCGSACTLTLPASPPSSTWFIATQSTGAATLTVSPNGLNLDGSSSSLAVPAGRGLFIYTDGSNYQTSRGMSGSSLTLQTNSVNNGSQTLFNLAAGTGMTVNDNGTGTVTIATSLSTVGLRALGMAFGSTTGPALTSSATQYVTIPFACTINQWDLTVDAGTATVDVWKLASGPADWAGTSGVVNTSGTAVTWVSGSTFPTDAAGLRITVNSVLYTIATVNSSTSITLTTSAGTQSSVAFAGPGSTVPTVANTITASALPAISSGTATGSSTLTGWTTSVVKNDVLAFNLNAVSTAKALTIILECQQ